MKRIATVLLILGAFVILLGLGTWQVQRLQWKEALIEEAENRPLLPPIPLSALLAEGTTEFSYRPVRLTGRFVGEPVRVFTTLSDARGTYEGPGYWFMRAFELSDSGTRVFVNRGFAPFQLPTGQLVERAPTGEITFEGLARPNDPSNFMSPDPDLDDRIVFRRDIAQLELVSGIGNTAPLTVDMPASPTGILPQAGETKFEFSNRHLSYAVTWYGLAVVLVVVVGIAWYRRRSQALETTG
ncbi:MAG: SURF1 family protein [Pseudomonadota bacterium]